MRIQGKFVDDSLGVIALSPGDIVEIDLPVVERNKIKEGDIVLAKLIVRKNGNYDFEEHSWLDSVVAHFPKPLRVPEKMDNKFWENKWQGEIEGKLNELIDCVKKLTEVNRGE